MDGLKQHLGRAAVIDRINVDTDQIIPKQFLKRIERTGFGQFLFYDWRFLENGELNPRFELNTPEFKGATILVAGDNFGCGSSREHAPWSLLDYGFRVLIAPSFADIFYNNSFKNGVLPIQLPEPDVRAITNQILGDPSREIEVDLETQVIRVPGLAELEFKIDSFRKRCLLNGLDDIGLTLASEAEIQDYEGRRRDFIQRDLA